MARKPKTTERAAGHGSRVTERAVREAAFESEDLAAAAERLGVPDLRARLKRSKRLSAAWERGRLLRRVREVAAGPLVPEAADKDLGLPKGSLAELLKTDLVVRELWTDTRFAAVQRVRRSIMELAGQGDVRALAAFERIIEPAAPGAAVDFGRVRGAELEAATGIKREQWLRWVRLNGCPQNVDATFSLPRLIDWLRRWERDQVSGGREAAGLNPLQSEKARRERRENDEAEGRLVPIDVHMEALTARAHCLYGVISPHRVKDIVAALTGREPAEQEEVLAGLFTRVLDAYKRLSPDIPVRDEARAKIEEGLALLMKETADERG